MSAMPDVDVTLLLLGPPASRSSIELMRLNQLSIELGLYIKISTNPFDFAKLRSVSRPTVAIVDGSKDGEYDVFALISILRCVQNIGIIVVDDHHVDNHRRALCAGADACLSYPVDPERFRLAIHEVARLYVPQRVSPSVIAREQGACEPDVVGGLTARESGPENGLVSRPDETTPPTIAWQLTGNRWQLKSPDGVEIFLTATERQLLSSLFAARRSTVSHAELLTYHRHEGATAQTIPPLASAISRLRKKCERKGVVLPILASRNEGYRFCADGVVRP